MYCGKSSEREARALWSEHLFFDLTLWSLVLSIGQLFWSPNVFREEDVATLSGFIQKIQGECTARHRNSDTSVPTQMALITYGETVNPRILLQLVNKVQESKSAISEKSANPLLSRSTEPI